MTNKKANGKNKKAGPDRQLPLAAQPDKPVKKTTPHKATRKKAVKRPARSAPAAREKDNQALLDEITTLRERLVAQHEELQKALLELETSRDKYRHLYNTTPVAYLTLDSNASIIIANAAGSELFGAGKRGLAGSAFSRLVEPGSQDKFSAALGKMLDTGEKQSCEIDMVRLDGTIFSAYLEIAGIPDQGSATGNIRVIAVDITARKKSEERLRDSEERYRLLCANIAESIYIIDRDFNITPVTPHLGKLLGYSPEEAQGRNLKDLGSLLPVSLDLAISTIQRVLAGETIPSAEFQIAARDGTYKYQEISGSPLIKDGKVVAAICVSRDITERKKAENELRESEERYHLLFETTSDDIFIIDRDFKLTALTPNMGKLLGYTPEELSGKDFSGLDFIAPESVQLGIDNVQRVLAGEIVPTAEYQFIGKDGKTYYQEVSGAPLVRDGKVEAAICIARDITERKKAEDALQISEEKYRTLVENANEAIAVVQDGFFKFFNTRFLELVGYDAGEILSMPFTEIILPEDRNMVAERHLKRLAGEKFEGIYSFMFVRKSGEKRWVELKTALIEWEGRPATLNFMTDITEHKKAEQALQSTAIFLNNMVEQSPTPTWVSDDKGTMIKINQSLCKLLQITEEELVGKYNVFNDEMVEEQGLMPLVRNVFEKGEVARFEMRYDSSRLKGLAANKTTITILDITIFPIKDAVGRITNAAIQLIDLTERKKAEEALQISEEKYRLLIENAGEGIAVIQENGVFKFVNRSFLSISGYEAEEILGKQFMEFISPEDRDILINAFLSKLRGEQFMETVTFRFMHKDGVARWVEIKVSLINWEGRPATLNFMTDVTERKHTEAALQTSEEKYRTLVENASEAIAIIQDERIKYANPKLLELTATTMEDLQTVNFFEFAHPDNREMLLKREHAILSGEKFENNYALRGVNKKGDLQWIETSSVLVDWEGRPATLNFITEITERKQAEAALQKETEWTKKLLEIAEVMIVVLDTEAKVVLVNPKACEILECACEKITGKDWISTFIPERIRNDVRTTFSRVISGPGDSIEYYENPVMTADGQEKIIEWQNTVMRDEQGRITGMLSSGKDITERKKAEEKLAESEEKYRTLVENAGEGIAVILDGHLKYANRKLAENSGYTIEELLVQDFIDLVHPEDRSLVINNVSSRLSGEKSENRYSFRVIHKQGKTVWLETNSILIDWEGRPATLNFLTDVTDRQEAEDKLLSTAIFLNNMVDQSPTATWIADPGGTMMRINKACLELFQANEEDLVGYYNIFKNGELERQGLMPLVRKVFNKGEAARFEVSLRRTAGPDRTPDESTNLIVDATMFPIRDAGGNVTHVAIQMLDLTSRKKAEASLEESNRTLRKILNDAVNTMAKIVEIRDPYTAGHQRRVADLSIKIAGELGLNKDVIENLHMAALIHDIGKIYVPAEILSKPGRLSEIEYGIIKIHAEKGYEIVKSMDLPCEVAQAILQHHERINGSGYPDGIKGDDINIAARILSVADVVEAMASHRPYRPARGLDNALQEITHNRGILFDPAAVDACLKLFMEKGYKFEE